MHYTEAANQVDSSHTSHVNSPWSCDGYSSGSSVSVSLSATSLSSCFMVIYTDVRVGRDVLPRPTLWGGPWLQQD